MTSARESASALGVPYQPPQWRITATAPIPPEQFGRDHYSTFAYAEARAVENRGQLNHDHMRCHSSRHPLLALAKRSGINDASGYSTRLRARAGQVVEQADHDDYDCLDDLVAAGWLCVTMPAADLDEDVFRGPSGAPLFADGAAEPMRPSLFTGLDELALGAHATWSLTDEGHHKAAALRRHLAEGGTIETFADVQSGLLDADCES